jgi:hypothetical protein
VLLNTGSGTFTEPIWLEHEIGGVAGADLDGDGKADLAGLGFGMADVVGVLLGEGDGTFAAPDLYPVEWAPAGIAAGDLSGDGLPDLAVTAQGDNSVQVLINQGDGAFVPGAIHPAGAVPGAPALADMNGDGVPDLVLYSGGPQQRVTVLLGFCAEGE